MSIGRSSSTGTRSSTSSSISGLPAADKLRQVLDEYQAGTTTTPAAATSTGGSSSRADRTKTLRRNQSSLRDPAKTTTARTSSPFLKKSVSFDDRNKEIIPIENVKSIPKRELHRRWMNETDFAKIRHETFSTLQFLDLGMMALRDDIDRAGDGKRSARGLERLTEVGMNKYRIQHRDAVFAVLRAQHQQQHQQYQQQDWDNAASPETVEGAIARAYREENVQAVREAIQLAQDDQKVAEQEYSKDNCLDLEAIRKLQQEQMARQRQLDKKTLLNQLIMKPARRLSRSWSLRTSMTPQA